jgi:hypothetical protein
MGGAVSAVTQPFADLVKDTGGNLGNLVKDTGGNIGNVIGGPVGTLVKDTTGNVGNLVKDTTSSPLGQAAILGGAAYLAAPYILGTSTAAGTGAAAGSSGVIPAGASAGGTALATGGGGAAYGSAGTLAGAAGTGSLLPGALGSSSFSGLGTGATTMATPGILDTLSDFGSSALDFAKTNPQLTGSLLGSVTGALSAANAPTSQTATTSIDPQIKAEYLANLERAKAAAAGLTPRQYADPGQMYTQAEGQLYNLGMTPFGAADIQQFYNPYENQVVQNTLSDIERARQMQALRDQEQATNARAFGGSRQGVQSALTNEAALRTAATTAAGLRQAGYTQAANLGLAARPMNISGLQTSLGLASQRDALAQARLDAQRNAALERLQITSGALGLQPANTGGTSTTPLYSSTLGSALGGALSGAYIGSLLQPKA